MRALPLLLAVCALAACGGGTKPPVDANRVNGCAESLFVAGTSSRTLEQLCSDAVRERLVDADNRLTPAAQERLVRAHASYYAPLCVATLNDFYGQVPGETSTTLTLDPAGLARRACAAIVSGRLDRNGGIVDPATLTAAFRAHPDLGAPILYAGLLASYASAASPKVALADWKHAARTTAERAWTSGIARVSSVAPLDLAVDGNRLAALFRSVLAANGLSA